jgi:hypothetical protein
MTPEVDGKTLETFSKALENEIKNVDEVLIPLLREYLNNIRDIRMAMGREVKHILESTAEIHGVTKYLSDIRETAIAIGMLERVLTPELMEKLKKLTKED